MEDLPAELLFDIFSRLDFRSQVEFASCSSTLYRRCPMIRQRRLSTLTLPLPAVRELRLEKMVDLSTSTIEKLTLGFDFSGSLAGRLPSTLRTLILGGNYDFPLLDLPNLTTLILDGRFDAPLILPITLRRLVLGVRFNQPLFLPPNIQEVTFYHAFNRPLQVPASIRQLAFGHLMRSEVNLPVGLETLVFPYLDQEIPETVTTLTISHITPRLPTYDSVTHLILDVYHQYLLTTAMYPPQLRRLDLVGMFCSTLEASMLPTFLEELVIGHSFSGYVHHLPRGLKKLTIGHGFSRHVHLPEGLEELRLGDRFDELLIYPSTLRVLELGSSFNQSLEHLPALRRLKLGVGFTSRLILPPTLDELSVWSLTSAVVLPPGLTILTVRRDCSVDLSTTALRVLVLETHNPTDVPSTLQTLTLPETFNDSLEMVKKCRLRRLRLGRDFNQVYDLVGVEYLRIPSRYQTEVRDVRCVEWI